MMSKSLLPSVAAETHGASRQDVCLAEDGKAALDASRLQCAEDRLQWLRTAFDCSRQTFGERPDHLRNARTNVLDSA